MFQNQFADRSLSIFWKQYSFSKGLKVPRDSSITIDPLSVIKNSEFALAEVYVKYLLEPKQFEGMHKVIELLKGLGIARIYVYYHPKTENEPEECYTDQLLGKKKRYSPKELAKKRADFDKRKEKMNCLREIENVTFIFKQFQQYHRREIYFFKKKKDWRNLPALSILCDRDFADLGNLEYKGIKGVTYTYMKFKANAGINHAELEAMGWKEGIHKQVNYGQSSYPVRKVLENKNEEKIISVGDTMNIQVVHFREKTHVDELQEVLNIQKPNYNEIKHVNIKTIRRNLLFVWDQPIKQLSLTEEQRNRLQELQVLDTNCLKEFKKANLDKDINIYDNYDRHDFHVNYFTLPNATPSPIRILCDEGFQYHMKEDADVPSTAKQTRPFLVVTLIDYKGEVKYCLEHSYFDDMDISSLYGLDVKPSDYVMSTTKFNLLAVEGSTIKCPKCLE